MNKKHTVLSLFIWLLVCQIPALVGSAFVRPAMAWYHTLIQPPLTPPDLIFGLAWSILYVLLGIAAFLLIGSWWKKQPQMTGLFVGQLVLNLAWTPVFFGLHSIGGALCLLGLMLLQGLWLWRESWKQSRPAAVLLLPYFGWLCFAMYLTAAFKVLN